MLCAASLLGDVDHNGTEQSTTVTTAGNQNPDSDNWFIEYLQHLPNEKTRHFVPPFLNVACALYLHAVPRDYMQQVYQVLLAMGGSTGGYNPFQFCHDLRVTSVFMYTATRKTYGNKRSEKEVDEHDWGIISNFAGFT